MNRLALAAGLGLIAVGVVTALAYGLMIVMAVFQGPELIGRAVAFGGLAWIALGAGAILVVLSPGPRLEHRFGPRNPLVWLWTLVLILLAGGMTLSAGQPALTALVFPLLHAAGAVVPALTVAAYVAWRAADQPALLTWRGVAAGLTWGGGVATVAAALAELIAVAVVGVVAYLILLALPGGPETVQRIVDALEKATQGGAGLDPAALLPALHPVVVVAAYAFLGVVGPVIEEVAKAAGVALRRPASALEGWAWGTTTGAGFGIVEAVMFGAIGLDPAAWGAATLARACATLMHATMSGLAGLGWYRAVAGGQRRQGAALIGTAIVGHGAWNVLVLTAVLATVVGSAEGGSARLLPLASLAAIGIAIGFTGIFLGFLRLTRSLAAPAEVYGGDLD